VEAREATPTISPHFAAADSEMANPAARVIKRVQPSAPMHLGTKQMVELMARITYRRIKQRQSLPVPLGEGMVNR
jgi:hypothetical protein